ncbi:hypothetical protein U8P80_05780 [Rhizobium beringeri]|uniref:hypothetical protein n=1 Tax=Rhizobium beringeri TaxID=3019934 RepID=UPI001030127E|nr:hypothetical protein [Rhizobium beringeri]TAU51998.1 hypothetical protein ELI43_03750 [Rhizobium leguminosarum]WSG75230.1 hypothetical protein U8P80_05780 [Rhizobium beringeri]WSH15425.1 hypothetical protein U8P74_05780 [Rhizobium beringeri]
MAFIVHHRDLIDRAPLRAVLAAQKSALQRHHPVAAGPARRSGLGWKKGNRRFFSTMPVAIAGSWRGSS